MTDEPVFETTLYCKNCGDEWTHEVPTRTEINRVTANGVKVTYKDCETFGPQCDCCYYIDCPTCELREHVRVEDRNPIEVGT